MTIPISTADRRVKQTEPEFPLLKDMPYYRRHHGSVSFLFAGNGRLGKGERRVAVVALYVCRDILAKPVYARGPERSLHADTRKK